MGPAEVCPLLINEFLKSKTNLTFAGSTGPGFGPTGPQLTSWKQRSLTSNLGPIKLIFFSNFRSI